jgi:hypothetical protein
MKKPTTINKAIYSARLRAKWKHSGKCTMCGVGKPPRGRLTCTGCKDRYTRYHRALKKQALDGYRHICICCGETRFEFLSFDHVNNDGAIERKSKGKKMNSGSFYRMIIREKFPKRYQILCWNCNLSLGFYGFCPHRPDIRRDTSKNRNQS